MHNRVKVVFGPKIFAIFFGVLIFTRLNYYYVMAKFMLLVILVSKTFTFQVLVTLRLSNIHQSIFKYKSV